MRNIYTDRQYKPVHFENGIYYDFCSFIHTYTVLKAYRVYRGIANLIQILINALSNGVISWFICLQFSAHMSKNYDFITASCSRTFSSFLNLSVVLLMVSLHV